MVNNLEVKKEEVLRYLGYRGQEIDSQLNLKIDMSINESLGLFRPKWTFREFEIKRENGEIILEGTNLKLLGKDINNLLKDSKRCILMAVTLGNDIEKKTRLYSKIDLTKSVIIDATATAAVEALCDNVEEEIRKVVLKENEDFTFRYSPGYGDLSLDIQREFIKVLDCKRRMGLDVSSNMILFPRKSVTAILGIINNKNKQKKSCKNCSNYDSCIYRKEDGECGCKTVN